MYNYEKLGYKDASRKTTFTKALINLLQSTPKAQYRRSEKELKNVRKEMEVLNERILLPNVPLSYKIAAKDALNALRKEELRIIKYRLQA